MTCENIKPMQEKVTLFSLYTEAKFIEIKGLCDVRKIIFDRIFKTYSMTLSDNSEAQELYRAYHYRIIKKLCKVFKLINESIEDINECNKTLNAIYDDTYEHWLNPAVSSFYDIVHLYIGLIDHQYISSNNEHERIRDEYEVNLIKRTLTEMKITDNKIHDLFKNEPKFVLKPKINTKPLFKKLKNIKKGLTNELSCLSIVKRNRNRK